MARLAPVVTWWQGVSRVEEGRAIARRRPGRPCWSRWTWPASPAAVAARPRPCAGLVGALRDEDLDVAGLMAVGPPGPPEEARPGFTLVSRWPTDWTCRSGRWG